MVGITRYHLVNCSLIVPKMRRIVAFILILVSYLFIVSLGENRYVYGLDYQLIRRGYLAILVASVAIILALRVHSSFDRYLLRDVMYLLVSVVFLYFVNPVNSEYMYSAFFLFVGTLAVPLQNRSFWFNAVLGVILAGGYLYSLQYVYWIFSGDVIFALEKYSIDYFETFGINKTGFSGFLGGANSAGAIYMFASYILRYSRYKKILFVLLYPLVFLCGSLTALGIVPVIVFMSFRRLTFVKKLLLFGIAPIGAMYLFSLNVGGGLVRLERYLLFILDTVVYPWKLIVPRNMFLDPFYSESSLLDLFHNTGLLGSLYFVLRIVKKVPILFVVMGLTNSVVNPMNMIILSILLGKTYDEKVFFEIR